jgi:prepilin-type N-terminal cleavage/methylation domain-containing protein
MKKAFTLIEIMIVVAIIAIIAAIAIPQLISQKYHPVTGAYISYSDVLGKTFIWNGNRIIVTGFVRNNNYSIVILPTNQNQSAVTVDANKDLILDAYVESLKNQPLEKETK